MNTEATKPSLEQVARSFINLAQAIVDEEHSFESYGKATLEGFIEALPDHNQVMLDALDAQWPELWTVVHELMLDEAAESYTVWTTIVNQIFETARRLLETD